MSWPDGLSLSSPQHARGRHAGGFDAPVFAATASAAAVAAAGVLAEGGCQRWGRRGSGVPAGEVRAAHAQRARGAAVPRGQGPVPG